MATHAAGAPLVVGIQEDVHVTGRRILATVVDGLVFGALFTVITALFGTITNVGFANWNGSMPALPSVLYGVIVVLYYILLEGYLGQTVGKMVLGIKVVREDNGEAPGLGGATIRYPNVASSQWVVVRTTVGRRRFCGTGTFALDTLGRFGELRNPRIGHRGSKGGERYGQRRDDRATDPLAPGVRPRDRAGRQRTSMDDRL